MVGDEEADFYMTEHTEYDKETFVDKAWSLMKPVIKGVALKPSRSINKKRKVRDPDAPKAWNEAGQEVDEDGVPIEDAADADREETGEEDMDEYDDYEDLDGDMEEDEKDEEEEDISSDDVPAAPEPDKKYDEATQALIDVADRSDRRWLLFPNFLRNEE